MRQQEALVFFGGCLILVFLLGLITLPLRSSVKASAEKAAKSGARAKAGKATTAKAKQAAVASSVTKKGVAGKVIMAILLVVILLGGAMAGGAVYQQKTGAELPIPEPITKIVSQVLPNKETEYSQERI